MIYEGEKNPYNKLSEELQSKLKTLEKPVVVIADGVYDPATNAYRLKEACRVPNRDRIYDPFQKKYIDIAMVESVQFGGEPKLYDFWLRVQTKNMMTLMPGNSIHEMIYEWLQLSNYSANRLEIEDFKRDPSKEVRFGVHDPGANGRIKMELRKKRIDAIKFVATWTDAQIKEFVAGWDPIATKIGSPSPSADKSELRDWVEDLADRSPENIIGVQVASEPVKVNTDIEENIRSAASDGVIAYNKRTGDVSLTDDGTIVVRLERKGPGFSWYKALTEWVVETNEGDKFYQKLFALADE